MSDSGLPKLNSTASGPPADKPAEQIRFNAQISKVPQDLQNLQQAKRLQGEVISIKADGTITVKTDQGQITAQLNAAAHYKQGQIIDLYLAKGNPPQNALITPSAQNQIPQNLNIEQAVLQDIGSFPEIASVAIQNVAGTQTTLTPLPPSQISSLVSPYTETLNTALSLSVPDLNSLAPLTGSTPPILPNFSINNFSLQPPASGFPQDDASLANLFPDKAHLVSFRSIAAYVFKGEAENFMTTTAQESHLAIPYERLPVSQITINAIEEQPLKTTQDQSAPLFHAQAGEIIGFMEGLSPDRHLPVISIPGAQDNAHFYVLNIDIQGVNTGTIVKFTPHQDMQAQAPNLLPLNTQITAGLSSFTPELWQSFGELINTIQHTAPQTAQAVTNMTLMPAAPQNMGGLAMFFIAALRSGDLQSWLGSNALSALKKAGKTSLINALRQEGFSHSSIDASGQEWRSSSLPLCWGDEIHKVIVHTRQDQNKSSKDQNTDKNHTRFVIDLKLSNIGPVQIDALHKKISGAPDKLDLALRTQSLFSKAAQSDMTSRYKTALEESEMAGDLTFQSNPESWVTILPDQHKDFAKDSYNTSI